MDRKRAALALAAGTVALGTLLILQDLKRRKKRRNRSVWTKHRTPCREEGRRILSMVKNELTEEEVPPFLDSMRMGNEHFEELLSYVSNDILKTNTHMREAISPKERLSLTLRFLATGESYKSLMNSTGIHYSTISQIIPEVCRSIYYNLKNRGYIQLPKTENEWEKIATNFEQTWNYPLCLGAIDGKNIAFRTPSTVGSDYYNYKGFNSLVLLAVVDSNYKFIYADAGLNGQIRDGEVFKRSSFFKALQEGKLNLPQSVPLPGREKAIPYHFIGDDAFSLNPHLMRPYPLRNLSPDEADFNYRLSRVRRVVENAFGILSNRFRILSTTINLPPEKVELIILTCVALHNFLATKNAIYYLDTDNFELKLTGLLSQTEDNPSTAAKNIREELNNYFNQNPL